MRWREYAAPVLAALAVGLVSAGCRMNNPAFIAAVAESLGSDSGSGSGGEVSETDNSTTAGVATDDSSTGGGGGTTTQGTDATGVGPGPGTSSDATSSGATSSTSGVGSSSTGGPEPCFEPLDPVISVGLEKNGQPVCDSVTLQGQASWDGDDQRIHVISCEPGCSEFGQCDDYAIDLWIAPEFADYYSEVLEGGCLSYKFTMRECGEASTMTVWIGESGDNKVPIYTAGVHDGIEQPFTVNPKPTQLCDQDGCEDHGAGLFELDFGLNQEEFVLAEGEEAINVVEGIEFSSINMRSRVSPVCDPAPQLEWVIKANL